MYLLRFDFRLAPGSPTSTAELYATSLDMCEWADRVGKGTVMFSQHHASPDGFLPSPMVLAAAAAARTASVPISVAALLLLTYDPVKVAEDMAVLDHLSRGRVSYTIGLGYRDEEYAMFGVDASTRGRELEERLTVLRRALSGECFQWRGRHIEVHPRPLSAQTPILAYGGGSPAAARRAARHGLWFFAHAVDPGLAAAYDEEARQVGTEPGRIGQPAPGQPMVVVIAEDVDEAWERHGPYLLHDAVEYAAWFGDDSNAAARSSATTVEELRDECGPYRIVTPDGAVALHERFHALNMHPLCGGTPPALAWESLRLLEHGVLPRI